MIDYDNIKPVNRVVLNSAILYVKMGISVIVVFFSTRLVLEALGADDFGVYNLVAGIISMLSFLKSAMAGSTQRYLSYYQGKNDVEIQRKIFINSIGLHILIGLALVLFLEIIGVFLFDIDGLLKIDPDKVDDAKIIYHFMSATMFFTIAAVPFSGTLNAHENILSIAIIELIEVFLRLGIAVSLFFLIKNDKLVYYGLLTASITVVSCLIYALYCRGKYPECNRLFSKSDYDNKLMKELSSFAGWNLCGSFCSVGKTQGIAIILNHFMGTIANAAYGITNQVVGQLNYFTTTMYRAFNPQIMKSEGDNQHDKTLHLSMIGCKFGFFLLAFVAIPFIFEMPAILDIWLKEVPQHASMFCSMVLVATMVTQMTMGLQSAIQASGNIKALMIGNSTIKIMTLPFAFIIMKLGYPLYWVFVAYIIFEMIGNIYILFLAHKSIGLSIGNFMKRVVLKEFIPVIVTCAVCLAIVTFFSFPFRWIITIPIGVLSFVASAYFAGLCDDEKNIIRDFIMSLLKKSHLNGSNIISEE